MGRGYRLLLALTFMALPMAHPARSIGEGGLDIALPDMGSSAETVLSGADEQRLGEAFMREVRARIIVIDEPSIAEYLKGLGYRLTSHGEPAGQRFTFFAIQDPAINAFAVPGGFIGVNAGLILATDSESELAAVLAHEIAHVRQHHAARSLEMADTLQPLAMAGMLAAIIAGTQSTQAGMAAMSAVTAGSVQKRIDFTRAHEEEADRLGILTLSAAGFDPRAMPSFFERLQTAHRYYSEPPEFLSTHPVTGSRIADSRGRAEQYPYRQYEDSLAYHLVRAHLTVMTEKDPKKSLRYFDDALERGKYRNRDGARYGLALASMGTGGWRRAKTEIQALLKKRPDEPLFLARLADIELATGRVQEAIGLYADARRLYPGNRLLTLGHARALLQGDNPAAVVALLERRSEDLAPDPALQKLLARALARMGRQTEANAALAEHYYLDGRLNTAIRQMRIALDAPNVDYYQTSRMEARLEQFERERALRGKGRFSELE